MSRSRMSWSLTLVILGLGTGSARLVYPMRTYTWHMLGLSKKFNVGFQLQGRPHGLRRPTLRVVAADHVEPQRVPSSPVEHKTIGQLQLCYMEIIITYRLLLFCF
jgi:hypothetical protein